MRATVILVAAATLLAACSSTPRTPATSQVLSGDAIGTPRAAATLATSVCEVATAPVYTSAETTVQRAVRAVGSGQIAPSVARQIHALGTRARADLLAACANQQLDTTRLAAAEDAVRQMQALMGGLR